MKDPVLLSHDEGGICTLTLNRPEKLNAFNREMFEALDRAITQMEGDPSTRVVVITGAGRAFSSGGDLDYSTRSSGRRGSRKRSRGLRKGFFQGPHWL